MKKRWIILIILVLLIAFGWFNFFVPHGSARRRLADFKQRLIAAGDKLDLQSLRSASRPGNNVATEFLAIHARWRPPKLIDYTPMMQIVAPGFAVVGHTSISTEFLAAYSSNKLFAAELRELLNGGKLDFNLDYSKGTTLLLPHLAPVKVTTLLLAETTMEALYNNQLDEAASDLNCSVDLLRAWGDEPLLISCLVRLACVRISIAAAWEALHHEGWTDAQLASLQTNWQQLDLVSPLDSVVAGERAYGIDALTLARKAEDPEGSSPFGVQPSSSTRSFDDWLGKLTADPVEALKDAYDRYPRFWRWKAYWSFEEELCAVQLATAAVDAARLIRTNGVFVPAFDALAIASSNIFKSHPHARDKFMCLTDGTWILQDSSPKDIYLSVIQKLGRVEASRRLLVTAIALKRYQLGHSAWPESLGELVPQYLPQVPIDFMDGRALRYKTASNGGFLLYSVGSDGIDGGGDPGRNPKDATSTSDPLSALDIVWPQPASRQQIKDYEARTPMKLPGVRHPPPTNP